MTMLMIFRFNFLSTAADSAEYDIICQRNEIGMFMHRRRQTTERAVTCSTRLPFLHSQEEKTGIYTFFRIFMKIIKKNIAFLRAICYNTKPDK